LIDKLAITEVTSNESSFSKEDSDTIIVLPKCELIIPQVNENLQRCRKSPFLKYKFRLKTDCFADSFANIKSSVVTYSGLCDLIVSYLIKNGLFLGDGIIKCDAVLGQFIEEGSVDFFSLAKHFRRIIN
jgi:hypothetical protein